MHIWHECLVMTKLLVEILLTVLNLPIGFQIQEQRIILHHRFRILSQAHYKTANEHHVTEKQNGDIQIKMCNNNGYTFITTMHNLFLTPDLYDKLFSIITLINLGHTCLFYKGFCMVQFGQKLKMWLFYHVVHNRNMHFGGKLSKYQNQKNSTQEKS